MTTVLCKMEGGPLDGGFIEVGCYPKSREPLHIWRVYVILPVTLEVPKSNGPILNGPRTITYSRVQRVRGEWVYEFRGY